MKLSSYLIYIIKLFHRKIFPKRKKNFLLSICSFNFGSNLILVLNLTNFEVITIYMYMTYILSDW